MEPILEAAIASFFTPPLVAPETLLFPIEWFAMDASYNEVRLVNVMTALENIVDTHLQKHESLIEPPRHFDRVTREALRGVIKRCLSKSPPEVANDVLKELDEKLQDLNRRSFRQKVQLLALRWRVPLDGISEESLKAAKRARDRVVHKGQYYEDRKDDDPDLWTHVTIVRELVVRFLFTALGYRGPYCTYVGGFRHTQFPPPPNSSRSRPEERL
jgi:hypothetical protein